MADEVDLFLAVCGPEVDGENEICSVNVTMYEDLSDFAQ